MGQALRRATGRVRSSSLEQSSPSQVKIVEGRPPAVPVEPTEVSKSDKGGPGGPDSEESSRINTDNVLEERDPGYDAMLSQMVGRIKTKPGGKLEMGYEFSFKEGAFEITRIERYTGASQFKEGDGLFTLGHASIDGNLTGNLVLASVMERYTRPMPKLRNTKPESGWDEEKPVPPGTLNVAQLRQVILLHQGKANDHHGSMDARQIAEKFRVDVVQVQRILQFLSLPQEDNNKQKDQQ
ncbi:hypothetical protein HHK36_026466 [Tetracentron sinense]|uniref:Uncharacterized protein n=1 Tax=Tetracentron sinense TaxID=13715 RepID=A0A835D278_TETSI|nr:hypothetical protein HHK36_026466 [Tetracentron sinense]